MNVSSTNIRVFPTTLRENIDPSAKFTTEYNLTSLLNKLLDRKAFVITSESDFTCTNGIVHALEFNIMGYFFSINNLDLNELLDENNPYINATIKVNRDRYNDDDNIYNYWTLDGLDSDISDLSLSKYGGVSFSKAAIPTYIPMLSYTSEKIDAGINSNPNNFTATDGNNAQYTFTILKYENNIVKIPADSRIKFQTNTSGSQHSLAIDDGELTSDQPAVTYNLRRPSVDTHSNLITGISLNISSITLYEGEFFRLEPSLYPSGDTDEIEFTSSDNNVATVSSNGLLRGINKGTCFVIASYKEFNATCYVTVN